MTDTFEAYCEGLKPGKEPKVDPKVEPKTKPEEEEIRQQQSLAHEWLCEKQQVDPQKAASIIFDEKSESPEIEIVPGKVWRKTVREKGTNEEYIVERKFDRVSGKYYFVTFRPIKFKSATKEITGKSGKTYTVPTVIIPKGTLLYRGVKSKPKTKPTDVPPTGLWVSWVKSTSSGYHTSIQLDREEYERAPKYLGVLTFEVQRDLELLDLWTPAAWAAILSEAPPKDAEQLKALAGIERESDKNGASYLASSEKTGLFPGLNCEERDKDSKCRKMKWRGLQWGPEKGNYKRKSQQDIDLDAIEIIYNALPGGFDGLFALPTPADSSRYPWLINPIPYGVFHEEINIRPLQGQDKDNDNRLSYTENRTSYGGKKTRRKQKKSKRTRTSKKK